MRALDNRFCCFLTRAWATESHRPGIVTGLALPSLPPWNRGAAKWKVAHQRWEIVASVPLELALFVRLLAGGKQLAVAICCSACPSRASVYSPKVRANGHLVFIIRPICSMSPFKLMQMQNITGTGLGTHWDALGCTGSHPCNFESGIPISHLHPPPSLSLVFPRPASWTLSPSPLLSARWHESARTPPVRLMLLFFPSLRFRFVTLVCLVAIRSLLPRA